MLSFLNQMAERKIADAIDSGELTTAKFKNKPLKFEDDSFVPQDLKMAYKILKNSGYVPEEVHLRKEIYNLEQLISQTDDVHTRLKQMKKLNVLLMKLDANRHSPTCLKDKQNYFDKIIANTSVNSTEK